MTDPLELITLPNRTIVTESPLLIALTAINSQSLFENPIGFIGSTALSVDIKVSLASWTWQKL